MSFITGDRVKVVYSDLAGPSAFEGQTGKVTSAITEGRDVDDWVYMVQLDGRLNGLTFWTDELIKAESA